MWEDGGGFPILDMFPVIAVRSKWLPSLHSRLCVSPIHRIPHTLFKFHSFNSFARRSRPILTLPRIHRPEKLFVLKLK